MKKIKELFKAIGKGDISENQDNLLSSGVIDSLDIMSLINEIEQKYGLLDVKFIEAENFESFASLKAMIDKAFKNN